MSQDPPARDRRQLLLAPGAILNGIDYIDVAAGQSQLSVHFLNTVTVKGSLSGSRPVTIIGGEVVRASRSARSTRRPTGAPTARGGRSWPSR